MARLSEQAALDLLRGTKALDYEDLDDVFAAFGFSSSFEAPNTTWYWHASFDCGLFRARPLHDHSVLGEAQKGIVLRMLACVTRKRGLEV